MDPVAQITQLTEGYVLATADGTSVACTDLKSLTKAIHALLPLKGAQAPANVVRMQRPTAHQPTPQEVRAALSPAPPAAQPPVTVNPNPNPVASLNQLPQDQIRNLQQLADATYRGLLQTGDIGPNLEKYCPNVSREQWSLFYSEYAADRRGDETT